MGGMKALLRASTAKKTRDSVLIVGAFTGKICALLVVVVMVMVVVMVVLLWKVGSTKRE